MEGCNSYTTTGELYGKEKLEIYVSLQEEEKAKNRCWTEEELTSQIARISKFKNPSQIQLITLRAAREALLRLYGKKAA